MERDFSLNVHQSDQVGRLCGIISYTSVMWCILKTYRNSICMCLPRRYINIASFKIPLGRCINKLRNEFHSSSSIVIATVFNRKLNWEFILRQIESPTNETNLRYSIIMILTVYISWNFINVQNNACVSPVAGPHTHTHVEHDQS